MSRKLYTVNEARYGVRIQLMNTVWKCCVISTRANSTRTVTFKALNVSIEVTHAAATPPAMGWFL